MFLKSLVVRGFKSFADKTALEFEPGITIVVGPNGSGKSNVIDAISWVLGEQGPRSLRGGKMEDVIFAGSPGRPALGRAEVSLTIDNSAGLLPIEFSEVTLTRVLFRSGESEYRLNGSPCRLLDIQEVLSDTGVGREQHTIVGQGQLDQVLQAGPEQLRGFIEEAAGVGKHRRRKDRAVRKIASTEQNLMRLSDLLAEVRRQLRPLREQAQLAQKHLEIEREFKRVRLLGAARSLGALRKGITSAGSEDFEPQIIAAQDRLRECEEQATSSESYRAASVRDSEEKQQAAWGFTRSVDRLKSLTKLAAERARSLQAELEGATEAAAQAKLAELKRQNLGIAQMLAQAEATETVCSADAQLAAESLNDGESELRRLDDDLANAAAAYRDATGELRRLQDEIDILAHSLMEAQTEQFRMDDASTELVAHLAAAVHKIQECNVALARLEGEEAALTESVAAAEAEVAGLEERHLLLSGRATQAEREAMLLRARAEVRVSESSSAEARRIAESKEQGVAGLLSDLVKAPPAINASLESWLGRLDCVVAISDPGINGANLDVVSDSGPVRVLVPAGSPPVPGLRPLADQIEFLKPQAKLFLTNVYLAEGLQQAASLALEHPHATFLAPQGGGASGGLVWKDGTDLTLRATHAEAAFAERRAEQAACEEELEKARSDHGAALRQINELDAAMAAAGEEAAEAAANLRQAEAELQALRGAQDQASATLESLSERKIALEAKVPHVEADEAAAKLLLDGLTTNQAQAAARIQTLRQTFEQAKAAENAAQARLSFLQDSALSITGALDQAEKANSGLAGRRAGLAAQLEKTSWVGEAAQALIPAVAQWAVEVEAAHQSAREELVAVDAAIARLRRERTDTANELEELRAKARQVDLSRTEVQLRARILEEKIKEDHGADPDELVAKFGHQWEVNDPSALEDPLERTATLDDVSLTRKQARLERELDQIGKVNPLAAEEYEALTEREAFLADQLADLRASRRDLFKVVASVDEKIRELFASAFDEVAVQYERLFAMLFPGGQGKLRLSEPNDSLNSGVEIEARPGGKNLKRLSLLSGGERSLSALALLFAIFRARPSPFYILDEVEAALDDVNLHRFLGLLREFRDSSQLLVVTHQKRTMEVADALYGVSIARDGVSRVISERLSGPSVALEDSTQHTS